MFGYLGQLVWSLTGLTAATGLCYLSICLMPCVAEADGGTDAKHDGGELSGMQNGHRDSSGGAAQTETARRLCLRSSPLFQVLLAMASSAVYLATVYCAPSQAQRALPELDALVRFAAAAGIIKVWHMLGVRMQGLRISRLDHLATRPQRSWPLAVLLTIELRYESIASHELNATRKLIDNRQEAQQLLLQALLYACVGDCDPRNVPFLLPLQVLLTIYLIWTPMHLIMRWSSETSPPMFGALWQAPGLIHFWTYEWHNVFASPLRSLSHAIVRATGVRALGGAAAFVVMAVYHAFALAPLMSRDAQMRVAVFFCAMGVGCTLELAIFGPLKHSSPVTSVMRALTCWVWALSWGEYVMRACDMPRHIDWTRYYA